MTNFLDAAQAATGDDLKLILEEIAKLEAEKHVILKQFDGRLYRLKLLREFLLHQLDDLAGGDMDQLFSALLRPSSVAPGAPGACPVLDADAVQLAPPAPWPSVEEIEREVEARGECSAKELAQKFNCARHGIYLRLRSSSRIYNARFGFWAIKGESAAADLPRPSSGPASFNPGAPGQATADADLSTRIFDVLAKQGPCSVAFLAKWFEISKNQIENAVFGHNWFAITDDDRIAIARTKAKGSAA